MLGLREQIHLMYYNIIIMLEILLQPLAGRGGHGTTTIVTKWKSIH